MLAFASQSEMQLAMGLTVQYLPSFLRLFEEGVTNLALTINSKEHFVDNDGTTCPVLVVGDEHWTFRLHMRNAFDDLLVLDREAKPVQVDARLQDKTYAKSKLTDVVTGRLNILSVVFQSKDAADVQRRLGELGDSFEWLRFMIEDKPTEIPESSEQVAKVFACPSCGERRMEMLAWDDDGERLTCQSCGRIFEL